MDSQDKIKIYVFCVSRLKYFHCVRHLLSLRLTRITAFVLAVCVKTDNLSNDIHLLFMQIGWNVHDNLRIMRLMISLKVILKELWINK